MASPVELIPGKKYKLRTDAPIDPATGRRRQVTKIFYGSKTEAKLEQSAFELAHRRPDHTGTSVLCSELFARWLTHCESFLEEHTIDNYKSTVKLYLTPHLGHLPVKDVRPGHLDDMYRHLESVGGKRVTGLAPSSIRRVHQVVRAAFTQAERWEWITRNPAALARPPKAARKKPVTPQSGDVQVLVDLLRANPEWRDVYVFVELLASLGARSGEVCALRWSDIDWQEGSILVERSVNRHRTVKMTKTDNFRTVTVDDETLAVLKEWMPADVHPDWFIFGGAMPRQPGRMAERLRRIVQRHELSNINARSLRHYVATRLIANRVDVRTVAGRLGHSSPATTLGVYADFVPENDRQAAELLRTLRRGK